MEVRMMIARTNIGRIFNTLGQSILSLSFNFGGLVAGVFLASSLDVFSITPWALLLFPGILSVRGAIGGIFSGRLSTALHLGTVKATFPKNTKYFYLLFYAIITLTLESGIILGLTASTFSIAFLGLTINDLSAILIVTITTMALSIILISPITFGISVLSFKRGLDPDITLYPAISTLADILVTGCYILTLKTFFSELGYFFFSLFSLIFVIAVCFILIKNYMEREYVRTLKECFLTIILVAIIVNVSGSILNRISEVIKGSRDIYMVYPALIDTVGDVGSIIGSTATTKFFLGTLPSSPLSIKSHLIEVFGAWLASLIIFVMYAIIASFTYEHTVLSSLYKLTSTLLIVNIMAVAVMSIISFTVAASTHKRGLDPDNFVIPIESSIADAVTTLSLFITLVIFH